MPPHSVSVAEHGQQLLRRLVREAAKPVRDAVETITKAGSEGSTKAPKPVAPTRSTFHKFEEAGETMIHTVAEKSHIPFWGVLLILLVIVLIILAAFYFCLAKWWRKFRESDKGAGFKGLDLKSVNLIGQLGKEKVGRATHLV